RAAGYAPGTFYKHFPDKRAVLLAAYEAWVTTEWRAIDRLLDRSTGGLPRRVVAAVLEFHRRWHGLRTSLRGLVAVDPVARTLYRGQRRRQLASLARMRPGRRSAAGRAADAFLLYTLERVCDALADGEARALGVAAPRLVARLEALVRDALA